jgi:hypothetical protein
MILDPNKDAFGLEKSGIPNRPVAAELVELNRQVPLKSAGTIPRANSSMPS